MGNGIVSGSVHPHGKLFVGLKVVKILATLTLIFNLANCSGGSDSGATTGIDDATRKSWAPLDVSDVAILWPRLRGAQFQQLLPVWQQGREKNLVHSKSILTDLFRFSLGKSPRGATNFRLLNFRTQRPELIADETDSWQGVRVEDLRIVSVRIDDCGEGLHQGNNMGLFDKWVSNGNASRFERNNLETCQVSLRLVAQPETGDNAVHLIYNYPKDSPILNQMMVDLQEIKKASPVRTQGKPLGVHPGFATNGGTGEFGQMVMDWILRTAQVEFLTEVALISTNEANGGNQWNFFKAVMVESDNGKQWRALNLDSVQGAPISQGFITDQNATPLVPGPPGITGSPGETSLRAIEANFDPRRSFTGATDCKSCHLATQLGARIIGQGGNQLFSNAQDVFDTPGVTSFPDSRAIPTDSRNFRALGWFEDRPTVIGWVAKKVGGVAQSMNKRFLEISEGEGANCSGQQHLVMRCLLQNAGRPSSCIQQICQPANNQLSNATNQ